MYYRKLYSDCIRAAQNAKHAGKVQTVQYAEQIMQIVNAGSMSNSASAHVSALVRSGPSATENENSYDGNQAGKREIYGYSY